MIPVSSSGLSGKAFPGMPSARKATSPAMDSYPGRSRLAHLQFGFALSSYFEFSTNISLPWGTMTGPAMGKLDILGWEWMKPFRPKTRFGFRFR